MTSTHTILQTTVVQEQSNSQQTILLKTDKKGVKWGADTVDNEHMNKKKSKRCCIYHKPHGLNESSDESGGEGECEHKHEHNHETD